MYISGSQEYPYLMLQETQALKALVHCNNTEYFAVLMQTDINGTLDLFFLLFAHH
jgi:hypothetical protein